MIPILAWRNTWRNPVRSIIVILAIAMGIWAAMFMTGFATGMARGYINNAINEVLSHIQVHQPAFMEDPKVQHNLQNVEAVMQKALSEDGVSSVSVRTIVNGMIASGQMTRGITVKGIHPTEEAAVTNLEGAVVEGTYFGSDRKNQMLVSQKLAEKLKVKLRSKLVLTFQDLEGTITAGAFRVVGIFSTGNAPFDEGHVFVNQQDLNQLLLPQGLDESKRFAHEMAIKLGEPDRLEAVEQHLQQFFPNLQVDTYREISPDLQLYESQIQSVSMIYLTVIMLALVFGIINTMLMAVLERIKELGMLMAIGMNKVRVFFMIVLETLLLGAVGAPLGVFLGWLTILVLGKYGIDLSAFSDSLQMYGLSEHIYFEVAPVVYLQIPVMLLITALIAAIYPAWKAIRLQPIEAIQKI